MGEQSSKRKRPAERARSLLGRALLCCPSSTLFFSLGWAFPSGGERDCKLSKRTVRKQEVLPSTRESEMKSICGAFSQGTRVLLLQGQFVRRYPSYGQGDIRLPKKRSYLVIASNRPSQSKVTRIPKQQGPQNYLFCYYLFKDLDLCKHVIFSMLPVHAIKNEIYSIPNTFMMLSEMITTHVVMTRYSCIWKLHFT